MIKPHVLLFQKAVLLFDNTFPFRLDYTLTKSDSKPASIISSADFVLVQLLMPGKGLLKVTGNSEHQETLISTGGLQNPGGSDQDEGLRI